MALGDGVFQILSGVVNTLDYITVPLGVRSPQDDHLVHARLLPEALDVFADALDLLGGNNKQGLNKTKGGVGSLKQFQMLMFFCFCFQFSIERTNNFIKLE